MTAALVPTVRSPNSGHQNSSEGRLIDCAFGLFREGNTDNLDLGIGKQKVDVPSEPLHSGQIFWKPLPPCFSRCVRYRYTRLRGIGICQVCRVPRQLVFSVKNGADMISFGIHPSTLHHVDGVHIFQPAILRCEIPKTKHERKQPANGWNFSMNNRECR